MGQSVDLHVWHQAESRPRLRGRTFRFAVGVPERASSNSWVVTTSPSGDVYVVCCDNFRELKASLHKSGRWRFGQTKESAVERPDLVAPGSDRSWSKWDRPANCGSEPIVAFEVYFPPEGLYLHRLQRKGWKKSVMFIESSPDPLQMVVVSVCVVPVNHEVDYSALTGGLLAVLDLDDQTVAHVIASYQASVSAGNGLEAFASAVRDIPGAAEADEQYPTAVVLAHGFREHVRFLLPLPLRQLLSRPPAS